MRATAGPCEGPLVARPPRLALAELQWHGHGGLWEDKGLESHWWTLLTKQLLWWGILSQDELRWRSSCYGGGFWAKMNSADEATAIVETKAVRSRGEDDLQQRHVMFCTSSVRIKWQILHFTSRLHILGRHRWVCNVGECWALRWGLSSTRDSFFCGWSSTTFLFVNRILEQVVGAVGLIWFLFLPCDVGLLHYSIIWLP
jgi:hypothetical protein